MRILRVMAMMVAMATAAGAIVYQQQQQGQKVQVEEWAEAFDSNTLDAQKWEQASLHGPTGQVTLKEGEVRITGPAGGRAGIRSRRMFSGDRFIVEAKLSEVSRRLPEPGSNDDRGFAILAVLFGSGDFNRLEWILRSDGVFEAWRVVDNTKSERLDNNRLATKEKSPMLAIVRRGNEFLFLLNGEVGLSRTFTGMPKDFRVMIYGFGTSPTRWDSVRVVTAK